MSINLTDPSVLSVRQAVESKSDPTTWFLLQYSPSPSPTLILTAAGSEPFVANVLAVLEQTSEEMLFGYAEVQRKGLVLVYMRDSVGGVRRARGVVHSRALASLYPDYSALITISHPSQLTEELVIEKLGLNYQPQAYRGRPLSALAFSEGPGFGQKSSPQPSFRPPSQSEVAPPYEANGGVEAHTASASRATAPQTIYPSGAPADRPMAHDGPSQTVNPDSGVRSHDAHSAESTQPFSYNDTQRTSLPRPAAVLAPSFALGAPVSSPTRGQTGRLSYPTQELPIREEPEIVQNSPPYQPEPPQQPEPPYQIDSPYQTESSYQNEPYQDESSNTNEPSITSSAFKASPAIFAPDRPIENRGVSSSEYFPDQRNRKTSSRSLRFDVVNPFNRTSSSTTPSPKSPPASSSPKLGGAENSPSTSRFNFSSLTRNMSPTRNFGSPQTNQGASGNTSQNGSPRGLSDLGDQGPPVPPKERAFNRPPAGLSENPEENFRPSFISAPNGAAYLPGNSALTPPDLQDSHRLAPLTANKSATTLSPSPSAREILSNVSQKSVMAENQIQERFRRGEEERQRLRSTASNSRRETVVLDEPPEEDIRLAYDEPDPDEPAGTDSRTRPYSGYGGESITTGAINSATLLGPSMRPTMPGGTENIFTPAATPALPTDSQTAVTEMPGLARQSTTTERTFTPTLRVVNEAPTRTADPMRFSSGQTLLTHQDRLGQEKRRDGYDSANEAVVPYARRYTEQVEHREVETGAEKGESRDAATSARRESEERDRTKAEMRARFGAEERARIEAEEGARRGAEERAQHGAAEAQRIAAEATRIAMVAARLAMAEEQARIAAEEQARIAAEEHARQEAQDRARQEEEARLEHEHRARQEEATRLEAEERARQEEARLEAEQRGRQEEADRMEAERARKAEDVRVRKESLRSTLARGITQGGLMLSGWVTVQTTRSLTWRRRWFHLLSTEMRLYKSQNDQNPIQVIHLGRGSRVEQTYEESQVQGSFKVVSSVESGSEEFFLFTDSPEDKESVLEGLAMAIMPSLGRG